MGPHETIVSFAELLLSAARHHLSTREGRPLVADGSHRQSTAIKELPKLGYSANKHFN